MAGFSGEDASKFADKATDTAKAIYDKAIKTTSAVLTPGKVTWTAAGEVTSLDTETWAKYKLQWKSVRDVRVMSAVAVYGRFTWQSTAKKLNEGIGQVYADPEAAWAKYEDRYKDAVKRRLQDNSKYKAAEEKLAAWKEKNPNKPMPNDPVQKLNDRYDKTVDKKLAKMKAYKGREGGAGPAQYLTKIAKEQTKKIKSSGKVVFCAPFEVVYNIAEPDAKEADARLSQVKDDITAAYREKVAQLKAGLKASLEDVDKILKLTEADTLRTQQLLNKAKADKESAKADKTKLETAEKAGPETFKKAQAAYDAKLDRLAEEEKEAQAELKAAKDKLKAATENKATEEEKVKKAEKRADELVGILRQSSGDLRTKAKRATDDIDALFAKEGQDDQKEAISDFKHAHETYDKMIGYVDDEAAKIAAEVKTLRIIRHFEIRQLGEYGTLKARATAGTEGGITLGIERVDDQTMRVKFTATAMTNSPWIENLHWGTAANGSVLFNSAGKAEGESEAYGQFFETHHEVAAGK